MSPSAHSLMNLPHSAFTTVMEVSDQLCPHLRNATQIKIGNQLLLGNQCLERLLSISNAPHWLDSQLEDIKELPSQMNGNKPQFMKPQPKPWVWQGSPKNSFWWKAFMVKLGEGYSWFLGLKKWLRTKILVLVDQDVHCYFFVPLV